MTYYLNPIRVGLDHVQALGDGQTINMRWHRAYPSVKSNKIAYHLYYSIIKENVFTEGVKYISTDGSLEANIIDLTPGQTYFFSVRPVEYDPTIFSIPTYLINAYDNLKIYPTSLLRADISEDDIIIPLLDITGFPPKGIVKIGSELIEYTSINYLDNNLLVQPGGQRGAYSTDARIHSTSGYDGYYMQDATVTLFIVHESKKFDRIFMCQSRFEYPNYQFTLIDGYHQVTKDILSTDLSASDEFNKDFPMYDYAGYHRTDPVLMTTGVCVGSYQGGEYGCIDGYGNINVVRGLSVQDRNNQRQEMALSLTGRPAVLIQWMNTGITCACYLPSSEYSDDRCPLCYGKKFVMGYQQFFNYPKRSDGRILVRVSPADDTLKMYEAGLESEVNLDLWTLTVPTIKSKDIIVLFDQDDNEEFRYEVISVTRNNTLVGLQGGQKIRAQRIRKTDPAYQIRVVRNTAMFPTKFNTSVGMAIPGIPPHTHEIVINEKIMSVTQINQTTSKIQGHTHAVINGVVMPVLGHTHQIIL